LGLWQNAYYGGGSYFAGDVAELLIFNRALTAGERLTVNGYLNGKYGFVAAVPAVPTNLVATAVSPSQVALSWSEPLAGGATQVSIERSTTSNGVFVAVAQLGGALSYVDTNLTAGTTYYYRVRAVNVTQWSGYSGLASATTPVTGTDVPFGALVLWLKADTGLVQGGTNTPVNLWADQSGNGNNAVQAVGASQPVWVAGAIGGRPVVRFNGASSYLNVADFAGGLNGAEALVVLKAAEADQQKHALWQLGSSYNSSGPVGMGYPGTDGGIYDDFGSYNWYAEGVPAQPLNQYHVYEVSSQTNGWTSWINGQLLYQTNQNTVGFTNNLPYNQMTLGLWQNAYYGGGSYFAGDVAELLIFNRALTAGERLTVNGYLNKRFPMATTLPAVPVLGVVATQTNMITIGWTAIENASGYVVERAIGTNAAFTVLADLAPYNETNYTDVNLSSGIAYAYRIQAINQTGSSLPSNEVIKGNNQGNALSDNLDEYLLNADPTSGSGGDNSAIGLHLYTPLK